MQIQDDTLLIERLHATGARVTPIEAGTCGFHLEVLADMTCLEQSAAMLKEAGLYPVFMTALHADPCCVLYYQFAASERPFRVMLSAPVDSENHARSLTPVFAGLQWHEREARDMFGIIFDNHPDMRPLLLCDEDRDLHPLRKDSQQLKTLAQLGGTDQPDSAGEGS
jgi:NADH-quinone oxidoreductase subunit C